MLLHLGVKARRLRRAVKQKLKQGWLTLLCWLVYPLAQPKKFFGGLIGTVLLASLGNGFHIIWMNPADPFIQPLGIWGGISVFLGVFLVGFVALTTSIAIVCVFGVALFAVLDFFQQSCQPLVDRLKGFIVTPLDNLANKLKKLAKTSKAVFGDLMQKPSNLYTKLQAKKEGLVAEGVEQAQVPDEALSRCADEDITAQQARLGLSPVESEGLSVVS